MSVPRRPWTCALTLVTALLAACSTTSDDGPPPRTCLQLGGTWDVAVDLDSQLPGTSVCGTTWVLAQTSCDLTVAAAPPCAACFVGSPDCWGAAGDTSGSPDGALYLDWSWQSPFPCDYVASLQAQTDGATLSGTIAVEQRWAPGGSCTGYLRFDPVSGTRRLEPRRPRRGGKSRRGSAVLEG
jgi:hypothetical protein